MAGNVVSNVKKYYGGQVPVPGQGDSDGKVKVLVEMTTTVEIGGVQTDVDLLYDADDLTTPVTPQKLGQWTDENYLIVFKTKDADGKVRGFILYALETTSTSTDTLVNNATFVAFKGLETDPGASGFMFTMVEDSSTLSRYLRDENGELTVKFNLSSVEYGAQSGPLSELIDTDSSYMQFEVVRDGDVAYLNLNTDWLDEEFEGILERLETIEGILEELPSDEHGYFNSSLYTTPGDGTTTSLNMDNFRISAGRDVHGDNIEFVPTHQEDGVDFGEVYLEPGTYIFTVDYTLQWVGSPRGTFLPRVANVGERPFDFSYEHEDALRTTRIVTKTARGKFGLNFPFDADTPAMGIWVKRLEIAQIASYNHPAVTHDTTLTGSGQIGDPLGVTPAAFGKVKDIPTSISQFRTGDVIPVDGPNGPAKMPASELRDTIAGNLENEVIGYYEPIMPTYKNGFVSSTGEFEYRSEGSGYIANSYDVSQLDKVRLTVSIHHNAWYASFYAGEPSIHPSMGLITFEPDDELELVVPDGAALLIVNSVFGGIGSVADIEVDNNVAGLTTKVAELRDTVKELQDDVNGEYEPITPTYESGFIDSYGDFVPRSDTGYTTNVYNVSQLEKVVLKTTLQHNAYYAAFYTGDPSTNPSMGLITLDKVGELVLDVPNGAALLIVNSVFGSVGNVDDVVVDNVIAEDLNDRLSNVESIVSLLDWSDKTWLMIGDSLTEKNFRAQVSYYDYVKRVTNVNLLNKGKSGNGYVDGDWFYTALGQVSADSFDFCTMFGSGNDLRYEITSLSYKSSWEEALGDINDNGTMSICGYMNRAISRFFELFPLKRIGIVTPTKWKNASYGAAQMTDEETLRRMTDYSRTLVQIANKWGIPVLDLFLSSGLQPQIDAYRAEFYNENGVQDPGVHPNSKGHKLIYKQFLNFINVDLIY